MYCIEKITIENGTNCKSSRVDERDLSHIVKGPTNLSFIACWGRLVSEPRLTKSNHRAEISGIIVLCDAMAPRPEVLLSSKYVHAQFV